MAVLVVAAAGAYVGAAVGIGAAAGWVIGSYLYSSFLAPGQKKNVRTSELNDLRVMGTEYGQPIPYIIGTMATAGDLWWNSDRRPVVTTSTTESGGKGGGGSETTTTVTTYDMDALIGLCDNRIVGVMRIWDEGKLVWSAHPESPPGSVEASEETITWDRMTVYTGDPAQMPDPTYEAAFGVGNVPAYRHRAYVFFEGLHLGQSGRVPNFTFEVVTDGAFGPGTPGALVAYWKLDEASGEDAIDSHGSNHLADVNTVGTDAGKINTSRDFEKDSNQYFTRTAGASLAMGDVDFTITCWIKPETGDTNMGIVSNWGHNQYLVGMEGGRIRFYVTSNSLTASAIPIVQDEWHFVICYHDAVNNQIGIVIDNAAPVTLFYPDGVDPVEDNPFIIGSVRGDADPEGAFDGLIDEVSIWKRMLTADERTAMWNNGNGLPYPFSFQGDRPGAILSETVTLEETVRRLLVRCGMVEGTQFDVSALASITKPVRALYVSQVSPTRQTIDALASTYFFDMVVSDKLYCRPRGGAIAATIPYEDLGAAFDGSSDELDQFILKNSGDLEFPARVSLVYRNVMHEYQVDTQTSDRLVSASADTAKVITLPLCFTPGEAKQVADVMLFNQAVNMLSVDSIKVLGDYVRLEPTDPVTVFDAQGNAYRMRLTSRRDEYPLLEYSAVLDDVAILASSAVTDENYEDSFVVEAVPLTVDLLLDIPMLRDADTDLGMYAVAKGATTAKWPGCVIYVSGDGVNYESVGAIAYPNIFGVCQTTLGNWPRGRLIDELNRVTVNIGPGVSLSSSTYERVVNNKAINACVIGDEVLQFIDATATGDGVYVLSRLLRGSQGTERVMGAHVADERFALLDPGRLGRVATPNNLLGAPLDYKFVTVGKTLESDAPETVANTGVNLKPISPVYLQVYRDPANNDATISWERRSRFTVRVLGPGGVDVPPDEVGWEIDVFASAAYATKVRTITATVAARPSAHYYAAEQSADGLTPGAPLFLRIYPMSGSVGRGFPLTASM